MIRVQDIVLAEKKKGVSQLYVYEHIIRDTFLISYSTFNRWISYPAKQELKHGKKGTRGQASANLWFLIRQV